MTGNAWTYAWQLAYDIGRADERDRIAESLAELDACRTPERRVRGWEEQVAERVALFERCAAEGHEQRGTRPWPGIPPGTTRRAEVYRQLLATWDQPTGRRAA